MFAEQNVTHQQIKVFAEGRVNLPADEAKRHRDQVNALRTRLEAKIATNPDFGLVKMLHAGSVAKGTALRTVNDLDVAVYVESASAPPKDPDLVPWLADRLAEASPSMDREQFEEGEHCVTVNFRGTGLNVDVVPVLYEGDPDDRGYLVRKRTGDRILTSIPLHLDFVRSRRKEYGANFTQLIRISKWWKRTMLATDPTFRFKSFMLELLWAHLADGGLDMTDYVVGLERFFTHIVKTELSGRVAFSDYVAAADFPPSSSAPIEILDPVNPENNVASRYSDADRVRIVDAAQDALSAIGEARFAAAKSHAVDCWTSILGSSFGAS
ncbi:MAG: CBASS oligonucleotide cyclase [Actinomycetota bacterium]